MSTGRHRSPERGVSGRATTWPDATDRPILLVPIGSCEQHGPHLPLVTDTLIAEAIAAAAGERTPGTVVTPALGITASGEHAGFAGTLSIGTDVMSRVVVELVRSSDWAAGVVLVNGHGGNRDAVGRATATLTGEGRRVLAWWPLVADGDAHAGRTETSMLLSVAPHLVRLELAERGVTEPVELLGEWLRRDGVRAVSPNGVLGDPADASAEEGAVILAGLTANLVAAIESWRCG